MRSEVADERGHAPYFSALDGVRALSIIAVFTWHLPGRPLADLNGFRGVTVFFVVSGLLITTLAIREESRDGAVSLRSFYTRRCFRIFPIYYLVLAGYVVVTRSVGDPGEVERFSEALPYYLFYLQELPPLIGIENAPFEQSWSLGFEEKFYLVWPVLGFVLARRRNALRAFIVVSIALVLAAISLSDPTSMLAGLTFSYVPILIGCGLAVALSTSTGKRSPPRGTGAGCLSFIALSTSTSSRLTKESWRDSLCPRWSCGESRTSSSRATTRRVSRGRFPAPSSSCSRPPAISSSRTSRSAAPRKWWISLSLIHI